MAHDFSLIAVMLRGGWTIGFLLLMSVVVFAVLYDRWKTFKKARQPMEQALFELEPYMKGKNTAEGLEACDRNGSFLAGIIRAGLSAKSQKADIGESMERQAKAGLLDLEK